ncbi:hypothetical protein CFRS1_v016137, partial [Colletotrichum fructicola]
MTRDLDELPKVALIDLLPGGLELSPVLSFGVVGEEKVCVGIIEMLAEPAFLEDFDERLIRLTVDF